MLSLNLALNASTRHIIGAPELARAKPGVVVVNTARGALIDEAALAEALDSGQVSAVGLDVYENEPKIHPGLVKNERAFLLPHVGTYTVRNFPSLLECEASFETRIVSKPLKSSQVML